MHFGAAAARDGTRNRLALGVTCGLHLLLALLWMRQQAAAPPSDTGQPPEFVTVLLQAMRPQPAVPAAPPPPKTAPKRAPAAPSAVAPPAAPAQTLPAAPPADAAPAAAPALPPEGAAAADAPASEPGFALGLAKRQARRIDRELRNGKSGVPLEADTPIARLRRGLEAAHIDRSLTLSTDTYTSPDGVIIYRFRQGNRMWCRRTGSVGSLLRGMPEANAAMNVDCPRGVSWERD